MTIHIPVLIQEVLRSVREVSTEAENGLIKEDFKILDCTFGGGGHCRAVMCEFPHAKVWAFDRDIRAVSEGSRLVEDYTGRLCLEKAKFSEILSKLNAGNNDPVQFDFILADIGVSTDQLKSERGFSFREDMPLDMRMSEDDILTAGDIVNSYDPRSLYMILRQGGVGQEARIMVNALLKDRPFYSTKKVAECIEKAMFFVGRKKKVEKKMNIHPATVLFQALRIAVNSEFEELQSLLTQMPVLAKKGARAAIIAFHSLEDKLIASHFRAWEQKSDYPASWPGKPPEKTSLGKMLTKKAVFPSEQEVKSNASSRSARMRIFQFQ
jgi:16S rRNA (cytosine1402-N4)-methyltransferase